VQLEEALAPEPESISPPPQEIVETERPEQPSIVEALEPRVQKQVRRSVVRGKRLGRPPFAAEMRASTVYLPESVYAGLEALANKSGKKGFKRPGLSETVALPLIIRKFARRAEIAFDRRNHRFSLPLTIRILLPLALGIHPLHRTAPPDRLVEPAALEV
jgi:hypothetical protein